MGCELLGDFFFQVVHAILIERMDQKKNVEGLDNHC